MCTQITFPRAVKPTHGSAADDEGQIFIEPQGMCVMSGVGIEAVVR